MGRAELRVALAGVYYLYLASLDEPGAYEALARTIAATPNGNDVTNLLTSLAELRTPRAKAILLRYENDSRTSDSPTGGPAAPISETVKVLLMTHYGEPAP